MCRWLMDAVSWERGTAAVLHSPGPPLPGIADAESTAKGRERSSCAGTGVQGLVLRQWWKGWKTVDVAQDGCDEDKHVAP